MPFFVGFFKCTLMSDPGRLDNLHMFNQRHRLQAIARKFFLNCFFLIQTYYSNKLLPEVWSP